MLEPDDGKPSRPVLWGVRGGNSPRLPGGSDSSIHGKNDYGYAWWIRGYRAGDRTYRTFEAQGNGGQCVTVIPDLDLVVTFMGGNYGQGPTWWRWCDELVPQFILPRSMGKWTRM